MDSFVSLTSKTITYRYLQGLQILIHVSDFVFRILLIHLFLSCYNLYSNSVGYSSVPTIWSYLYTEW